MSNLKEQILKEMTMTEKEEALFLQEKVVRLLKKHRYGEIGNIALANMLIEIIKKKEN